MINYILLVSRQGSSDPRPANDCLGLALDTRRKSPPREMVLDHAAEAEGEDCEGRHPARSRAADAHV